MNDKEAKEKIKKLRKEFEKYEDIIWLSHPEKSEVISFSLRFLLFVFFAILLYFSKTDIGFATIFNVMFFSVMLYVMVLGILENRRSRKNDRIYILTNKKAVVLADSFKEGKLQMHYANMTDCQIHKNKKEVKLVFFNNDSNIQFEQIEERKTEEAYSLVLKQVFKLGASFTVRKKLQEIAKKYKLELVNSESYTGITTLKGKLDKVNFSIKIEGVFPLETLHLEFDNISNPKANSFRIQAEDQLEKLQKIKADDLEVGNQETDDTYVLESNDLYFLKSVLTKEIREKLNTRSRDFESKIEFGNYKKARKQRVIKTKFKADDSVLDAHLLKGIESEDQGLQEVDPSLKSKLSLHKALNRKIHGKKFVDLLEDELELILALAKAIKLYNTKTR